MIAASALFLAMQAAQPVTFLPSLPPLYEWENVQGLSVIRANGTLPEDTVPVMEFVDEKPGCRSVVGPMPAPRDQPNVHVVGFSLDVLVLVLADGRFFRIVAGPGPCEEIRNYARALVNTRYQRVIAQPEGPGPAWYRARLLFVWQR